MLRFSTENAPSTAELRGLLEEHGFSVMEMSYGLIYGGGAFEYRSVIVTRKSENIERLVERLRAMEELQEFRVFPTSD